MSQPEVLRTYLKNVKMGETKWCKKILIEGLKRFVSGGVWLGFAGGQSQYVLKLCQACPLEVILRI